MKFIMKNEKVQSKKESAQEEKPMATESEQIVQETAMDNAPDQQTETAQSDNPNRAFDEVTRTRRHLLYEDKKRRMRNGKVYVGNDGTLTAVYKNQSVHYQDPVTGEMNDIDNRLTDTGDCLETRANAFKTRFIKNSKNGEVFQMLKGNCKATLTSRELKENACCKLENCTCEDHPDTGEVLLRDVKEHIDIQYIAESDRVKENIIVKQKLKEYDLSFDLNIENMTVGISEDKKVLELKDKETGEVQFTIPGPFMTDAAGEYSEAVHYEIDTQDDTTLSLKVVPDKRWMNSKSRVYPITIDPQIVASSIKNIFSYETRGQGDKFLGNRLIVHNGSQSIFISDYGYQSLVSSKIKIHRDNDFVASSAIKNAKLKLKINTASSKNPKDFIVMLGGVTGSWNDSGLGCDSHDCSEGGCHTLIYYIFSYQINGDECIIDLTDAFQRSTGDITISLSYTGALYGMLSPNIEFYTTGSNAPVLEIEYEEELIGIEITAPPTKTTYFVGEIFHKSGMIVKAIFNSGRKETITDYMLNPSVALTLSDKEVVVSYKGFTAKQSIVAKEKVCIGICITKAPDIIEYTEGENINLTGMEVVANYDNGDAENITGLITVNKLVSLDINDTVIIISYLNWTANQPIKVKPLVCTGIQVSGNSIRTEYFAGEFFDPENMVITASFNNGISRTVTDYEISNNGLMNYGDKFITITYKGHSVNISVFVHIDTYPQAIERYSHRSESAQIVSKIGVGTGIANLATGNVRFRHPAVYASELSIGLDLVYNSSMIDYDPKEFCKRYYINEKTTEDYIPSKFYCGNGWKLSLQQYLLRRNGTDFKRKSRDYTYVDGDGNHHSFNESYYINTDDGRQYLEREQITIKPDGTLAYVYNTGKKQMPVETAIRTESGMELVSRYDGFQDIETIELRAEELAKLETEVEDLRFYIDDLEISKKMLESSREILRITQLIRGYQSQVESKNLILEQNNIDLQNELVGLKNNLRTAQNNLRNYLNSGYSSMLTRDSDRRCGFIDMHGAELIFYSVVANCEFSEINDDWWGFLKGERQNLKWNVYNKKNIYQDLCRTYNSILDHNQSEDCNFQYNSNNYQSEVESAQKNIEDKVDYYDNKIGNGNSNHALRSSIKTLHGQMEAENNAYFVQDFALQTTRLNQELKKVERELKKVFKALPAKEFSLARLKAHAPVSFLMDKNGGVLGFNSKGHLVVIADAYGNYAQIEYEGDKIVKVTGNNDASIKLEYNAYGNLSKIICGENKTTQLSSWGYYLSAITLPGAEPLNGFIGTRFDYGVYGPDARLTKARDVSGLAVKYSYDSSWSFTTIEDLSYIAKITDGGYETTDSIDADGLYTGGETGKTLGGYSVWNNSSHVYVGDTKSGKTYCYICNDDTKATTAVYEIGVKPHGLIEDQPERIRSFCSKIGDTGIMIKDRADGLLIGESGFSGFHAQGGSYEFNVTETGGNYELLSGTAQVVQFKKELAPKLVFSAFALSIGQTAESARLGNSAFGSSAFALYARMEYTEGEPGFSYCGYNKSNLSWVYAAVPLNIDPQRTLSKITLICNDPLLLKEYTKFAIPELKFADWEYDEYRRGLKRRTLTADGETLYRYDSKRRLIGSTLTMRDGGTFVSANAYDTKGRIVREEDYDGIITETVYDKETNEAKSVSYHKADPVTLLSKSGPDEKESQNTIAFGYGLNGELLSVSGVADGEHNTNRLSYSGRFVTKVKTDGFTANYEYDGRGRTTRVVLNGAEYCSTEYPEEKTASNKFIGYSMKVRYPDNTDAITTLANGERFLTKIDCDGKVIETKYIAAGQAQPENLTANVYNSEGRIVTAADYAAGTFTEYAYRFDGATVTEKDGATGAVKVLSEAAVNSSGSASSESVTVFGQTHSYAYEYGTGLDKTKLKKLMFPDGSLQSLEYDLCGRLSSIRNGGTKSGKDIYYTKIGDKTTDLVSSIRFVTDNKVRDNLKYRYDQSGNITEVLENGRLIERYAYDNLHRLIREDNKALGKTIMYHYDTAGNMTNRYEYPYTVKADLLEAEPVQSYEYVYEDKSRDRLISVVTNRGGAEIQESPIGDYDALGNPHTYRCKPMIWERGRCLRDYGGNTFAYNANGLRTRKNATEYFYSGSKLIAEQTGGDQTVYVYGAEGIAGIIRNNEAFYFRKNLQGDVIAILDSAGKIVVKYAYDAWGNCKTYKASGNSFVILSEAEESHIGNRNPFRYRGYYFDIETGLYYLCSRYYDPEMGRFINADAIEYLNPETVNGLNLYAYCGNNPVINIDPTGTAFISIALAILGIFSAAIIGGAIQGSLSAINAAPGEKRWGAFMGGFVNGFISTLGLAVGLAVASYGGPLVGVGLLFAAGAGFLGGLTGSHVSQQISYGDTQWEIAYAYGLLSAVTNTVAFGALHAAGMVQGVKFFARFLSAIQPSMIGLAITVLFGSFALPFLDNNQDQNSGNGVIDSPPRGLFRRLGFLFGR